MEYDPQILGIRMRQYRNIRGFKQSEVAERLGITAAYYSMIENGKKNISVAQLMEFAEMHQLPVSVVLGEDVDMVEVKQEMTHTDLEIMSVLQEMTDKDKKQLLKHLQIMKYPEIEVKKKDK